MENKLNSDQFRQVLGQQPTAVCAITSEGGNLTHAMIVGSFTSVSLSPPLVGFLPAKTSTSWPKIELTGRFCANILSRNAAGLCNVILNAGPDKLEKVAHKPSPYGLPILDEAVSWVDCTIERVVDAGDHFFVLGKVDCMGSREDLEPLVYLKRNFGVFTPL